VQKWLKEKNISCCASGVVAVAVPAQQLQQMATILNYMALPQMTTLHADKNDVEKQRALLGWLAAACPLAPLAAKLVLYSLSLESCCGALREQATWRTTEKIKWLEAEHLATCLQQCTCPLVVAWL
jgi:hypothetical protein